MTVTNGVVPESDAVTLDPGVYAWKASYSGDTSNAPSKSFRESGIEIVLRPGSDCPTGSRLAVGALLPELASTTAAAVDTTVAGCDNHGGNGGKGDGPTATVAGIPVATAARATTTVERSAADFHCRNSGGGWSGH